MSLVPRVAARFSRTSHTAQSATMAFRKDDRLKDGPMPQYAAALAEVDDTLHGRDIEGPAIIRRTAGAPAAASPPRR